MRWLFILIFMLLPFCTHEAAIPKRVDIKKADFRTTLTYILKHEGYYSYTKNDLGGETYCGVSRVQFPKWVGWQFVDGAKPLGWNNRVEDADFWVLDFYLDIWVKEEFYEIRDQSVANYLFDFRINATVAPRIVRRSLNELGFDLPINNTIDSAVIVCINKVRPAALMRQVQANRIAFYKNIVKRDRSQKVFLNHWLERSKIK